MVMDETKLMVMDDETEHVPHRLMEGFGDNGRVRTRIDRWDRWDARQLSGIVPELYYCELGDGMNTRKETLSSRDGDREVHVL